MVFGKVLGKDSQAVVKQIEAVGSGGGTPSKKVKIVKSGRLEDLDTDGGAPAEPAEKEEL